AREIIDGTVTAIGTTTADAGRGLRRVQTGHVQNYALGIAIGLIVMAGSYLAILAPRAIDLPSLPILTLIPFTPLVGSVLIAFVPRQNAGLIRALALGTALVS